MRMQTVATCEWMPVPVNHIKGSPNDLPIESCQVKFTVSYSDGEYRLNVPVQALVNGKIYSFLTNDESFITIDNGRLHLTGMSRIRIFRRLMHTDCVPNIRLDFSQNPTFPRVDVFR